MVSFPVQHLKSTTPSHILLQLLGMSLLVILHCHAQVGWRAVLCLNPCLHTVIPPTSFAPPHHMLQIITRGCRRGLVHPQKMMIAPLILVSDFSMVMDFVCAAFLDVCGPSSQDAVPLLPGLQRGDLPASTPSLRKA